VIRARGREDGDGEVCERARASVWLFGAASFGTEVRERLALVRAHLINRPPNRPHLRFAHQYHGIQLSAPLLLAPALPYMTKLSPSLSHCWSSFDFYFGPSRLPLSTLPPAGTKWGLLCRTGVLLHMRRPQQNVQHSRLAHCSHVANFYSGVVRYRVRGSFPTVALSARQYPHAPWPLSSPSRT
jgi:hypothetical protein